ncbi:roundabout homolog 1-like [Anneissia japonica]|uniref:roundabout homolog 1-like n=1 Tax=Anneissia japonica TaxID=1529436 RepID=UPI00142587F1|nr:roundabout homolog 1-like [Anneissia japonica]
MVHTFIATIFHDLSEYWDMTDGSEHRVVGKKKDDYAPTITEHPRSEIAVRDNPASFRCRADAQPAATIRWYKDGEQFDGTGQDGDLFFLKVTNNHDSGVYYCEATNYLGSARSNNATLDVAYIKSEFKKHPQAVEAIAGGTYVLECTPPRAFPAPDITWEKDKDPLVSDGDRVQIVQDGNLMIKQVREEDEGSYVCIAENMANKRKSDAGVLTVVSVPGGGPTLSCSPVDKMVHIGKTVSFCCQVDLIPGATQPTIYWHKGTQLRLYPGERDGKISVLNDGNLQIAAVSKEDEGYYFCTVAAEQTISAQAYLRVVESVELPPIIRRCPYNQTLREGTNNVWLQCDVEGSPQPQIEWLKNERPMSTNIRIHTLASGSLQISELQLSDAGLYTCVATVENFETRCSAELTVTNLDGIQRPNPKDSEFPGAPSMPTARNTSNGHVIVSWGPPTSTSSSSNLLYRIEGYDNEVDATWQILANNIVGTSYELQNLRSDTTYVFYIRAINSVGAGPPSSVSHAFTTGDTMIVPGSGPSNQRVDITNVLVLSPTAFKVIWNSNCPSCKYNVKYRKTNGEGIILQESAEKKEKIITGLSPGTSYTISVQPVDNSIHGSDSVDIIKQTLEQGDSLQSAVAESVLQDKLDNCNIQIKSLTAESNTSARVQWKISKNIHYVDGVHIRYAANSEYMIQTATRSQENTTLTNLKPYTEYTVTVIPFLDNFLGAPSNEEKVKTKAGVPEIAPQDVYALRKNTTTVMVGWQLIQSWHVPGQIREYHVMCIAENPKYNKNVTVSGSTDSILVTGLEPGVEYRVKVMASTETGVGPVSDPVNIVESVSPPNGEPGNSSSLILGVIIGVFFVFFSCFVFFVWKWRQAKKNSDIEYKAVGSRYVLGPVSQDNSDVARHVHTTGHQQPANWHQPQEDFYSHTHGSDSLHSSMEQYAETGMVVTLPNSNMFSNIDPTAIKTYSRNAPEYAVVENAGSPPVTPHTMQTLPYPPRNFPIEFNRTTSLPPHMTQPYASTTLVLPPTMREFQERQQSRGNSSNSEHSGSSRSAFKKNWNGELDNGGFSSSGGSVPPPLPPDRLGTLGSCMSECTCTTTGILTDSGGSSVDERGNRRRRTYPRGHKLPAPNITELLPPPPEHPPPSDIESAFGSHHTLPSSHHHGATIPMSSNPVTQPHITTNPLSQMDMPYKNYGPMPMIHQISYPESNSDNNASPVTRMHNSCSDNTSDCNMSMNQQQQQRDSLTSPTAQNICNLHARQSPHSNLIPNHQVFEDPRHAELGKELLQFNDDVSQSEAMSDNEDLRPVIPATCRLKQTAAGPGLSLGLTNGIGYSRGTAQSYPYLSEMSEVSESEMSAKDDETDLESNCTDSMMASWASINVSGSESSARNSRLSSSDGSFFTETDFASALTQAAENVGIPVVNSNGVQHKNDKNKSALKNFRQRFPSDTDSCASGAEVKKKRPTASKKKNSQDPNQNVQSNLKNGGPKYDQIEAQSDASTLLNDTEMPPYNKPQFPSTSPSNTFSSRRSRRSDGDLEQPNELTNMVEMYRDMNDLGMTVTNNPLALSANTSV